LKSYTAEDCPTGFRQLRTNLKHRVTAALQTDLGSSAAVEAEDISASTVGAVWDTACNAKAANAACNFDLSDGSKVTGICVNSKCSMRDIAAAKKTYANGNNVEAKAPHEFDTLKGVWIAPALCTTYPTIFSSVVKGLIETGVKLYYPIVKNAAAEAMTPKCTELKTAAASHATLGITYVKTDGLPCSVWQRDQGPTPAKLTDQSKDKKWRVAGALYVNDGTECTDKLPEQFAAVYGRAYSKLAKVFEWGNFANDEQGNCAITVKALLNDVGALAGTLDQFYPAFVVSKAAYEEFLHKELGCITIYWFNMLSEDSTGHIDLYLVFGKAKTVLLGKWLTPVQNNALQAQDNAVVTAASTVLTTDGFTVTTIDFGGYVKTHHHITYLNSLVIKGADAARIVMPYVPGVDPCTDEAKACFKAKTAWATFVGGGATVILADATNSLANDGAVHCVTKHLPAAFDT